MYIMPIIEVWKAHKLGALTRAKQEGFSIIWSVYAAKNQS